jgi:hypothetical protein
MAGLVQECEDIFFWRRGFDESVSAWLDFQARTGDVQLAIWLVLERVLWLLGGARE